MDISLMVGMPTASTSGSQPASSGGGSFALDLQQALGKATAPLTSAPDNAQPVSATGELVATLAAPAQPPLAELAVLPDTNRLLAEARPAEDATLLAAQQQDSKLSAAELLASLDSAAAATVDADPLAEVRRRMALIEQAGQLPDAQAMAGAAVQLPAQAIQQASASPSLPASNAQTAARSDLPGTASVVTHGAVREDALAQVPTTSTGAAQAPASTEFTLDADSAELAAPAATLPAAGDAGARSESLNGLSASQGPALLTASSTASAAQASASLSAPLASRDWQAGLGQQLIGLHQRGEQHIELHLHPAELGPLSISLKLTELGAQAQFLSAHPQVRAAIEQALPQLREALAAQGINLGETSVGSQSQPQRDDQPSGDSGARTALAGDGEVAEPLELASQPAARVALGQVDLYA